jgi:hypothetical protein
MASTLFFINILLFLRNVVERECAKVVESREESKKIFFPIREIMTGASQSIDKPIGPFGKEAYMMICKSTEWRRKQQVGR